MGNQRQKSDGEGERKKRKATRSYGLSYKLTEAQKAYRKSIFDNQMTIVEARAATGKTTIAVATARTFWEQQGMPLLYVFNPVEEDTMGFRSGDQRQKEADYLRPLLDALVEIGDDVRYAFRDPYEPTEGDKYGNAWVEAYSHVFVRGTTIKDRFVIIAEAQNWRREDLKKMLTRLHDSCKVVVEGHMGQCDLKGPDGKKDPSLSGFPRLIEVFDGEPYVGKCELHENFRGRLSNRADDM